MSTEQQDFEELKRLLALKRHEQPARGFFSRMTEDIRDRLQHPPPTERLTWWQRLRTDIDVKACAFGVLVCGLMLYAMLAAMGRPPSVVSTAGENTNKLLPPTVLVVKSPPLQPIPSPAEIPDSATPIIAPAHTNAPPLPAGYKYLRRN